MKGVISWIWNNLCRWLVKEGSPSPTPLCDFNRLSYELRPGDVLLIEGRSRISEVIKMVTQSNWTHAALYIGRLFEIENPELRAQVEAHYHGDRTERLLVEALLGEGTVVVPVAKYRRDHLRICRPAGLSPQDARRVVDFTIRRLGSDYDVRHMFDLARFFLPWSILPRRWRSSLFQHHVGAPTRTVCSHLLASAFNEVNFPILPFIDRSEDGTLRFYKRNPRLFTPKDFDYSPYFNIIKYPYLGLDDLGVYRKLPWAEESPVYNDDGMVPVAADMLPDNATVMAAEPVESGPPRIRLVKPDTSEQIPAIATGEPNPLLSSLIRNTRSMFLRRGGG